MFHGFVRKVKPTTIETEAQSENGPLGIFLNAGRRGPSRAVKQTHVERFTTTVKTDQKQRHLGSNLRQNRLPQLVEGSE